MLWHPPSQTPEELAAECYDGFYQGRDDVSFFVAQATRLGDSVLEVGCGTGRILFPMAQSCPNVWGIDLSDAALQQAEAKIPFVAPGCTVPRLQKADMRAFDLGQMFKGVFFPFRSFQEILTVEERLACLACARNHLEPHGLLVLDLYHPSIPYLARPLNELHGRPCCLELSDGRRVNRTDRVVERDYHRQTQVCLTTLEVEAPHSEKQTHDYRLKTAYLFRNEVECLLRLSGFSLVEIFGDYNGTSFGHEGSNEMVILAEKK